MRKFSRSIRISLYLLASLMFAKVAWAKGFEIGIDGDAADANTKKVQDIAQKLAEIEAQAAETRTRIVQLQTDAAARLEDLGNWELSLKINNPKKIDLNRKTLPIALQELSIDLNGFPIIMQHTPLRTTKDQVFVVYSGPIPAGEYDVRLRVQVGVVPWEWPAAIASGRWLLDKVIRIAVKGGGADKPIVSEIGLTSLDGNKAPTFLLNGVAVK